MFFIFCLDKTNRDPLKPDEDNQTDILINYSVDDQEYMRMLKNFKKLKNDLNEGEYKELTIKSVLDRALQNPSSNFESMLSEQPKNFKKKRKVVIKKSPPNKQPQPITPNNQEKLNTNQTNKPQLVNSTQTPKQKSSTKITNPEATVKTSTQHHSSKNNSKENYASAPASFFSLIRNVFYNDSQNEYKLTLHKLEELVKEKLRFYDPKLGWQSELVQSAMNYLSSALIPPKNVPLVDYKEKNQQWQWIANESCDRDEILIKLTEDWMGELNKYSLLDPSQPVPPSICKTDWTVKESTSNEKEEYRQQEVVRYQNPNKSFTFNLHNYKSIVGPVKGVKGCTSKELSNVSKHKEKTALLKERPPFVTLLSLVRDSAARLPNGEGTRFDICSLLKDSQYLRDDISDEQISAIVSGALDRLHYEKDPCVRYDVNQKRWIYLHRYRTEDDFNRLHKMQIEANLAKKNLQQKVNSSRKSSLNKSSISNQSSSASAPAKIATTTTTTTNTNQLTITPNAVHSVKKDTINKMKIVTKADRPAVSSLLAVTNNQVKQVNLNQTKLIELSHEIKQEKPETKRPISASNTKRPIVQKPNIVRIRSKADEGENTTYATTFSNIKSDLLNKSIKQKYQKLPTITKKLKTDHPPNDDLKDATVNNETTSDKQRNQIKITNTTNNFTIPSVLSAKSPATTTSKDDANKIVIQQNNGNRINLSTNVILNSANGPLILCMYF